MISRVGVAVPAHDEEELIGACLDALMVAAGRIRVPVDIVVVLDDCRDATAAVCATRGVETVVLSARNVGAARAAGMQALLARNRPPQWLATTDADSRVAPDWLAVQLRLAAAGADVVVGVVDIDDWSLHPAGVAQTFAARYGGAAPGTAAPHSHVHGANLGLRSGAYEACGGFAPLAAHEDHALLAALGRCQRLRIERSTAARVTTSSRLTGRASSGFAGLLRALGSPTEPAA